MISILLSAVLLSVRASNPDFSGRAGDTRLTWFEETGCGATASPHYTGVVGPRSTCMLVPGTTYANYGSASYSVTCNDAEASGVVLFYSDRACANVLSAQVNRAFTDETCYSNPPEFGASSLQAQCQNPLLPPADPLAGRASVLWASGPDCSEAATSRVLVDVRQASCQTVPSSVPGGYKVSCSADGTIANLGIFTDATCVSQVSHRVLDSNTCSANTDPNGGAAWVAIRCSSLGTDGEIPASSDSNASASPSPGVQPGLAAAISSSPSQSSAPTYLPGTTPSTSPRPSSLTTSGASGIAAAIAAVAGAAIAIAVAAF